MRFCKCTAFCTHLRSIKGEKLKYHAKFGPLQVIKHKNLMYLTHAISPSRIVPAIMFITNFEFLPNERHF